MPFEVTKSIKPLIAGQFPEFYSAEESKLIDFIEAYYEWMELPGNVLGKGRLIHDNIDIDTTLDEFVENFKNKFMSNLPSNTAVDTRTLLKHISDLYKSKGSLQSFKLLFRLLFDLDATLYYPGKDVLKASDGVWKEPEYLEVSSEPKASTFVSKEIIGEKSGAKAFVESRVRRLISGGVAVVLFISNIRGNFQLGERITSIADNSFINSPTIKGSLTTVSIIAGGQDNAVGDVFDVVSAFGVEGEARVTEIESGTGKVGFELLSGGSGFTLDNNTSVIVSTNVVTLTSIENRSKMTNLVPAIETNWGIFDDQSTNWKSTKTAADDWTFEASPWSTRQNEFWEVTGNATLTSGFETPDVAISPGLDYRFIVPFKTDATALGNFKMKVSPGGSKVVNLDGSAADDLFMDINFATAALKLNTWYVAIGHVLPQDHTGTTNLSGLYEAVTGERVGDVAVPTKSFKWADNTITTASLEFVQSGNTDVGSVRLIDKPIIQIFDIKVSDVDFAKTGYNGVHTDIDKFEAAKQNIVIVDIASQTGTFVVDEYVTSRTGSATGTIVAHGTVVSDDGTVVKVNSYAGTWGNGGFIASDSSDAIITSVNGEDDAITSNTTGSDSAGFGVHDILNGPFIVGTEIVITGTNKVVADIATLSTGTGATFAIGGLQGTETLSLFTDFLGGKNHKGVPYMDIKLDGSNSLVGFIEGFQDLTTPGTGFIGDGLPGSDQIIFKGGGLGTGANPAPTTDTFAIGLIRTVANDQVTTSPVAAIEITEPGKGYSVAPVQGDWVITTTAGIGLVATADMDFGFGFPKAPHGDLDNIIDFSLTSANFTIGEITALTKINPGNNYNADPFVIVINPFISGFNRRDLILEIANPSGTFLAGEEISQSITSEDFDLVVASTSDFSVNDTIIQKKDLSQITFTVAASSNAFRVGMIVEQAVSAARGKILAIDNVAGTLDVDVTSGVMNGTNNIAWEFAAGDLRDSSAISGVATIKTVNAIAIIRTVVDATNLQIIPLNNTGAKFTNSTTAPLSNTLFLASDETKTTTITTAPSATAAGSQVESFSKGRIKSVVNEKMFLKRTVFGLDFDTSGGNAKLTGGTSGVTADLISVEQDGTTEPMGLNATIDADVSIANGIAKTLEIIDSGFGYLNDEEISLEREGHAFILSGRVALVKQGKGKGFWQNTNGFLNSDKFLHDNDFYQAFSYEIQVGLSLDKYKDTVLELLHTSGTRLFGRVIMETDSQVGITLSDSTLIQEAI